MPDQNPTSMGSLPTRGSREIGRVVMVVMVAVVACAASASAQLQFDELTKRHLPADDDLTLAVALGDVDGDGDLDAVFGSGAGRNGGQNRLYSNGGVGVFTDVTLVALPTVNDGTFAASFGDLDGDGDLDVVFANSGQNRVCLNDGAGKFIEFTATNMPVDMDVSVSVAIGDVDGDGDLDLIFGNGYVGRGEQNRLYLNDGTGKFLDVTKTRLPADTDATMGIVVGDVDGDGDADLVLGNHRGQSRLYTNDGTGTFADVTATRLPFDNGSTFAVAMGDLDADGDPDLVFANGGQPIERNQIYLNNGRGAFSDATAARLPANTDAAYSVVLGDLDGDGVADLVFGNNGQNRLYRNDGAGTFRDVSAASMPADSAAARAVAMGDVDGDGDRDLVFGNYDSHNRLYANDRRGVFTDASAAPMPTDADESLAIAVEDVNGDGDPDLIVGNNGAQNRLYTNDGSGSFRDETIASMPAERHRTAALSVGDVDGDGDRDLVFGNWPQQNRLYLNDGVGRFTDVTAARMPFDGDDTLALALGDVDGDGDLDLVCGNDRGPNRLYVNDGAGAFTDGSSSRMPSRGDDTLALALCDVDGDGDPDLVVGNAWQQDRLLQNDGSGVFTDVTRLRLPVDNDLTLSIASGDVDGDGDLDLVLGSGGRNRLYLNDGAGGFVDATAARMPAHPSGSRACAFCDVDGDGDLDLVFGNRPACRGCPWRNRLYANDGTGHFVDVTVSRFPDARSAAQALAIGDVDRDGDPDLVFANHGQNRLYSNLSRQLLSPLLVRPGGEFRLEAYARYGPPRASDVAIPYVATRTASIPLPSLGTLGIDPTQMIGLRPLVIPQPVGVAVSSLVVPVLQSLVGVEIYAQALLIQSPARSRLTNVTADVVVQ